MYRTAQSLTGTELIVSSFSIKLSRKNEETEQFITTYHDLDSLESIFQEKTMQNDNFRNCWFCLTSQVVSNNDTWAVTVSLNEIILDVITSVELAELGLIIDTSSYV